MGASGCVGASLVSGAPGILNATSRIADPACTLNPEITEGPYYIDRRLLRQNITEGRPGLPLRLRITVLDANHCSPLRNAAIDVWHCDAEGVYSGYTKAKLMRPPPDNRPGDASRPPFSPTEFRRAFPDRPNPGSPPHERTTDDKTFFRGVQITGDEGTAEFTTIVPGWYVGRPVHIHMKIWVNGAASGKRYEGGYTCQTGQLFFPEDFSAEVAQSAPYRNHHVARVTTDQDHIFSEAGSDCVLQIADSAGRSRAGGVTASAVVAVNPLVPQRESAGFGL